MSLQCIGQSCQLACRKPEQNGKQTWTQLKLTPAGERYMRKLTPQQLARLRPGQHYRTRVEETSDRVLFPDSPGNAALRHAWFLQRRARPLCPHFAHSAVPRRFGDNVEQNAKMARVYFGAWTLDAKTATANVPYAGNLCAPGETWEAALRRWATCLPCQETKQYLGNFLSVYRVRPAADANENSDDENVDEPLELSTDMLPTALQTQEPFQTATKTTTQGSTQSIVSASGFQLAETTWSKGAAKTAATMERTGYEELDPKALQRAARVTTKVLKPRNPPASKIQSPRCATATTCSTESRAQKVLA